MGSGCSTDNGRPLETEHVERGVYVTVVLCVPADWTARPLSRRPGRVTGRTSRTNITTDSDADAGK